MVIVPAAAPLDKYNDTLFRWLSAVTNSCAAALFVALMLNNATSNLDCLSYTCASMGVVIAVC
jgi:hypothetical protein